MIRYLSGLKFYKLADKKFIREVEREVMIRVNFDKSLLQYPES